LLCLFYENEVFKSTDFKYHLTDRQAPLLNEGLRRKLTPISAPAGFGKTTLLSEWTADFGFWPPPIKSILIPLINNPKASRLCCHRHHSSTA